jgi:hypothetical protein
MGEAERTQVEKDAAEKHLADEKARAAQAQVEAKASAEAYAVKLAQAKEIDQKIKFSTQSSVSYRFMSRNTDFYPDPTGENVKLIVYWFQEHFDCNTDVWTEENVQAAWDAVKNSPGVIHGEYKPPAYEPAPPPPPSPDILLWGYKLDNKKDMNAIPHDEFKRLMLTNPAFKARVQEILRGAK